MLVHANFQVLNRILIILLHLCCSSASPRLVYDSTFIDAALFWDFYGKNCHRPVKTSNASMPFRAWLCYQPQFLKIFISLKSVSARAWKSLKCCILMAACQRLVQMLAKAFPFLKSVMSHRKRRLNWQIRIFQVCLWHPVVMTFLSLPAHPLTADTAQSKSSAAHHDMSKHVQRYFYSSWLQHGLSWAIWAWFYRLVGLLVVVSTQCYYTWPA